MSDNIKTWEAICGDNGKIPSNITRGEIDAIVTYMFETNTKTIDENKFGISVVWDTYAMKVSSELVESVSDIVGFISLSDYPDSACYWPNEFGIAGNMRFLSYDDMGPDDEGVYTCTALEIKNDKMDDTIYRDVLYLRVTK